MGCIVFVVGVAALLFWLAQLIDVTSMGDDEFDGRNDKLIFFIIVFFGSIFGAIGFWLWKSTRTKEEYQRVRMAEVVRENREDE